MYRRRRLVRMRPRVVFGTLARVMQVLAPLGWHLNTAFIERVNLILRQHIAALGRRVITVAKSARGLRAQLHLSPAYYNFVRPVGRKRIEILGQTAKPCALQLSSPGGCKSLPSGAGVKA